MTSEEKKLLQAKHRLEEAQARDRVKERKARTRRLIQEGDYSGRSAHALKRVQRTGIAVQQSSAAVQPRPLGMG